MSNGDGGGFDFSGLFDPFLGVIGGILGEIITFLNALVSVLGAALNFLFAGELGIFGFARSIGEIAHSILKFIIDQIFKVWVVRGLQHLLDLYNKLRAWARKLKAWLDKWRKLQQLTQGKALRDFINMIQRIRRVLVIFRILHLRFATKLDNWLAGIEGTLIRNTLRYAAKTNEIIGWLDVFIDPRRLLSGTAVWRSIGRDLAGIRGTLGALGLAKLFPQLTATPGAHITTLKWQQWSERFNAEAVTESGDYGEFARSSRSLLGYINTEVGS